MGGKGEPHGMSTAVDALAVLQKRLDDEDPEAWGGPNLDREYAALHVLRAELGRMRAALQSIWRGDVDPRAVSVEALKQRDVFECRYCKQKVDFLVRYHSDELGLWHWECPQGSLRPTE